MLPVILACFLLSLRPAYSAKVFLKIQARNPADWTQTINVKSYLPANVQTNDILSLAGLELGYDVKKAVYHVYKEVELDPEQTLFFEVELKDLWIIPEQRLDDLQKHATSLKSQLRRSIVKKEAVTFEDRILQSLHQIRRRQADNDIARVDVEKHISAYNDNMTLLEDVKRDIVRLENLALSIRYDPEKLLRDPEPSRPFKKIAPKRKDYKKAAIKVSITNPSPTDSRNVTVKHDLPREVRAADVLDAGDLEVRTDFKRGICYVHKDGVVVLPKETVVFDIVIRDKWNLNKDRVTHLQSVVVKMLTEKKPWRTYKSIMNELKTLTTEIEGIAKQKGPETVSDKYVAFYRNQAEKLDRIENMINRIKNAPCHAGEIGMIDEPPTPKTTWRIIYIILIFLGVMSALVILRSLRKCPLDLSAPFPP